MQGLIPDADRKILSIQRYLMDEINKLRAELNKLARKVEKLEEVTYDDGK